MGKIWRDTSPEIYIWKNNQCLMSFGNYQLKQPWDTTRPLLDWLKLQTLTTLIAGMDVEQQEHSFITSSIQSLSCVPLFGTPLTAARQASLSITNSLSLLKLMSIKSVMPFNHLILCCPFLLLPSVFPSFRVFSNESVLIRLPKYWSFSFSISPSNEYSGLISFRIDLFDFLAVKGTLKSLQHHSSKASVLQHSTFFMVQLQYPYMTTGKTIAFTRWTFVGKVMSLLFNMLSRLVIAFLPKTKCLNLMAAVTICKILEPKKIKSATVSVVFPSTCHVVIGLDTKTFSFFFFFLIFFIYFY